MKNTYIHIIKRELLDDAADVADTADVGQGLLLPRLRLPLPILSSWQSAPPPLEGSNT